MKHVVNKNLDHNGKLYAKGDEIKPSDPGFKELLQAGHANEVKEEAKAASEPEQKSVEQAKPASKSKK